MTRRLSWASTWLRAASRSCVPARFWLRSERSFGRGSPGPNPSPSPDGGEDALRPHGGRRLGGRRAFRAFRLIGGFGGGRRPPTVWSETPSRLRSPKRAAKRFMRLSTCRRLSESRRNELAGMGRLLRFPSYEAKLVFLNPGHFSLRLGIIAARLTAVKGALTGAARTKMCRPGGVLRRRTPCRSRLAGNARQEHSVNSAPGLQPPDSRKLLVHDRSHNRGILSYNLVRSGVG